MLLHYQIHICISGHSKFNMDWIFFINCCLLCLLGCLTYNNESAITFAILEKYRKEKLKILLWYTCKNIFMGISNAPKVYSASYSKNNFYTGIIQF